MKKYLYILATMFIGATALTGCSNDDNVVKPTPSPTPAEETDVVDLGLTSGTLWATANLGATNNYETGNLYAWGETWTKTEFSASNYFDPTSSILKSNITGTDYDAAKTALGGEWVMPTAEQFEELFNECKVSRTTLSDGENEIKVLKLVGPNEKVLYIPEVSASVTNAGTLYDEYTDEKGKPATAKYENVYAAYWTGDIANITESLNANQYAVQALYVEHAKDAVKKGGESQYGSDSYNRSRLAGAPIRPVKANGGTPVSSYVDIKGIWAQCDATGKLLELSEKPAYMSIEGTNYSGDAVLVTYGISFANATYSRTINELTFNVKGIETTMTVADVTTIPGKSDDEKLRVISLTYNGETNYMVQAEEAPAVAVADLAGKWDVTVNGATYVLNILDGFNCIITNSADAKESATFEYRFGTIAFDATSFDNIFAVVANEGAGEGDCPFQFVSGETTITPTVHPKEYETLISWNGVSDAELPSIFTTNKNNALVNDSGDGKNIKQDMMNIDGTSSYTYAIKLNKSVGSTDVGEVSKDVASIDANALKITYSFKTGDRIRIRGYFNSSGKTGSFKVFDSKGTFLGTGDPGLANYADKVRNVSESVFNFAADVEDIYISREAGTGTFVCEFYIDREKED